LRMIDYQIQLCKSALAFLSDVLYDVPGPCWA
jgi:hypothetical protein